MSNVVSPVVHLMWLDCYFILGLQRWFTQQSAKEQMCNCAVMSNNLYFKGIFSVQPAANKINYLGSSWWSKYSSEQYILSFPEDWAIYKLLLWRVCKDWCNRRFSFCGAQWIKIHLEMRATADWNRSTTGKEQLGCRWAHLFEVCLVFVYTGLTGWFGRFGSRSMDLLAVGLLDCCLNIQKKQKWDDNMGVSQIKQLKSLLYSYCSEGQLRTNSEMLHWVNSSVLYSHKSLSIKVFFRVSQPIKWYLSVWILLCSEDNYEI